MSSASDFYFGLLRVSMIQLLKSQGFDKARPTTVDAVTDLYLKYFALLTTEIIRSAQSRVDQDDTIALQDLTLAFQNLGLIKPMDVLDVYDENPSLPSDKGMLKFKEWCVNNHQAKDARIVALPTSDLLRTSSKSAKPLSLIPEYINQLQHETKREDQKVNNEDDKLIEELINNGDVDDWIRLVFARQKINLARRISGKEPHHMDSLPSIAGLKHSVLEHPNASSAPSNQLLPASPDSPDREPSASSRRGAELLQKLPIMRPGWKIENITLSFEDDEDMEDSGNGAHDDKNTNDSPMTSIPPDLPADNDFDDDFNPASHGSTFILDSNTDTQFAELEDMDNTFQRRESLDFGDASHDNQFDFNGF